MASGRVTWPEGCVHARRTHLGCAKERAEAARVVQCAEGVRGGRNSAAQQTRRQRACSCREKVKGLVVRWARDEGKPGVSSVLPIPNSARLIHVSS